MADMHEFSRSLTHTGELNDAERRAVRNSLAIAALVLIGMIGGVLAVGLPRQQMANAEPDQYAAAVAPQAAEPFTMVLAAPAGGR